MNNYGQTPPPNTPLSDAMEKAKTDAKRVADQAASTAGASADMAKQKISDAYDATKDAVTTAASSVASATSTAASDATKALHTSVEDHKNAGATALANLARSARESADAYHDQAPQVTDVVKSVADRVERVSNDIKDTTVSDMVDSLTEFAQKKPMAFLGCGILAGLVLARLLTPPSRA